MDNHTYNLIKSLSEKAEGLWVYEKFLKDSLECPTCRKLWQKLQDEDRAHLDKMMKILKEHVNSGTIS